MILKLDIRNNFNDGGRVRPKHVAFALAPRTLVSLQQLECWRAVRFQNVALALAPCAFVFETQLCQGWTAVRLQHVAVASAPRTFVLHACSNSKNGGVSFSKCGSRMSAAPTRLRYLRNVRILRATVVK
eukprot:968728-Pyramimonas_sp.AAC.1